MKSFASDHVSHLSYYMLQVTLGPVGSHFYFLAMSLGFPRHMHDPKPWGSKIARNIRSSRGPGNEAIYF